MQKERLLNLLGPDARRAFDSARRLARLRGGVLSPLHLLVALIEDLTPGADEDNIERTELLRLADEALSSRYTDQADSITVPKETQTVLTEAGRIALSESSDLVLPVHLLRAALATDIAREALKGCDEFKLKAERLFASEISDATVTPAIKTESGGPERSALRPSRAMIGALGDYCSDLAEESLAAASHPFVGREREVTAMLETLCRKLKNNPLLIGKPGVGKTALVSAVALKLCEGRVPQRLRGKRILEVSRIRLLADAKYSGDIEERIKNLLEEVRRRGDVILFFDEIHTLLNAGGISGMGDVANLLKSALSKGEITCVGATTLAEYYRYIARDEALARRFSTIIIDEPSPEETRRILTHSCSAFESYHGINIDGGIISLIVEMADRYLHSRSFPDKAFDLLDKAAAKATLAGHPSLTRECVTETLSETTGLPLEIMDEDPAERLERLEDFLNQAVPGQPRAARDVARVVRIAKLGLELRPERPDGVFLFVGPEGVGKHEMATALARFLYGSPNKITEFDMSQFTHRSSMSRLIGADPSYVGYGERSGLLSKAAEDNPHSVLYFRNIDMADQVVQQFLGEAFEQGRFTDASGTRISLSNTTVVMTLSGFKENTRGAQVGFVTHAVEEEDDRRGASGKLSREHSAMFVDSLAATIDEVVEFQVLDREATEKI
ncbi:MAG TPA: ATP-dependent Clp protease ATP-binding subunit, partial [Blastocatellia bacterium]|nr:ATP-dependent Clp protease ATP-binding subunit [Blastocatellia bacterium]